MENNSILTPRIKPIMIDGRIYYNENERCNNIIRLKKELLKEFNQLNNKDLSLAYRMELYRITKELIDRIMELAREGKLPILLFFYNLMK